MVVYRFLDSLFGATKFLKQQSLESRRKLILIFMLFQFRAVTFFVFLIGFDT